MKGGGGWWGGWVGGGGGGGGGGGWGGGVEKIITLGVTSTLNISHKFYNLSFDI